MRPASGGTCARAIPPEMQSTIAATNLPNFNAPSGPFGRAMDSYFKLILRLRAFADVYQQATDAGSSRRILSESLETHRQGPSEMSIFSGFFDKNYMPFSS